MKLIPVIAGGAAACLVLAVGACVFGATAGVPESWTGTNVAGWVNHDLVNERTLQTLRSESNSLKLVFGSQSILMPPEEYVFEAGTNASAGRFTGDYVAQGVSEIRFRLLCERRAEVSVLLCSGRSKRVWRYRVPGIVTGVWMSVSVPVAVPAVRCVNDEARWANFESDLRDVSTVGVAIERAAGMTAQAYWLDDFALAGEGAAFADWMAQFPKPPGYGTGDCSVLSGADLDGDGALNREEWVAGSSAGDAGDRFRVSIERTANLQSRLRWKAAPGRVYQVWSTADLGQPFEPVSGPIGAELPENSFEDSRTNGTKGTFYRVGVGYPQP